MIRTQLPYNMEQMEQIMIEGAIVDMSQLQFPSISDDKQMQTALIFLRNTGFNKVQLDFSTCTKEMKQQYVDTYFTSNIKVKNIEFARLALMALFQKQRSKTVSNVAYVLAGVPLFFITKLAPIEGVTFKEDYLCSDFNDIGPNYMNLLQFEQVAGIILSGLLPVYYTKIFNRDDYELMQAVINSPCGIAQVLNAMKTMDPEVFSKGMKALYELAASKERFAD